MSRFSVILMTALLIGGGWWAWQQFGASALSSKPIRYVKIEGAFQYTSKDRLKEVLAPQMKQGYYQADMNAIHQAIKALPLVDKVDVKRVWPDAVHIKITEQKPVVRWGKSALLNKQGDLLVPDNIDEFKNLPLITGPDGQEKKLLEIMKGVYIVLKDKSMQLAEFHVNERRAWRIKLASGMEMQLGRKAPLENMQRFLRTMDLLGEEQLAMIASVDTRYPNGFAVTWKPEVTNIDWKAIVEKNKNLI
ncbi:cell division protein FtsQ/DivIB [Methylomonas sp. MO1]|uniref:cell division protein FtsQ/DivIB n=1 Tax=unclassified Methylomonas TaxID=2608980 RepID=UPI00047A8C1E|nr:MULTISPECIES: cell division protein FtsQ/DivIB [unclassified Methylomonas]MDT4289839.1 cell division protein FtsQ/DivIB [Methylomonas sp. MO1]